MNLFSRLVRLTRISDVFLLCAFLLCSFFASYVSVAQVNVVPTMKGPVPEDGIAPGDSLIQGSSTAEIERMIDSLRVVQVDLEKQLDAVTGELDALEFQMQQVVFRDREHAKGVLITNMDASLRQSPSPSASVIRTVPPNTILEAISFDGAYWKVKYDNAEGWIMRLFVEEGEGAEKIKEKGAGAGSDRMASQGMSRILRQGKQFLVTDFGFNRNTANGVSVYYAFEQLDSTRTIREVTLSVTPYDEDGIVQRGNNSGVSTRRLRRFSAVNAEDGEQRYRFENVWYNGNIDCVQIERVDLAYTNGSRQRYTHDALQTILPGDARIGCQLSAADQRDISSVP